MVRLILYLFFLGCMVAAAVWAADRPGSVQIDWLGYRVSMSVPMLLLLLFLSSLILASLWRMSEKIIGISGRITNYRQRRRLMAGHLALTRGLVALVSGEPKKAQRQVKRAEAFLPDQSLALLLAAQTAQLDGNEDEARKHFQTMLTSPNTIFLGLRGLLGMALQAGQMTEALDLARRAYVLQNQTPWILHLLFDLLVRHGLWLEAEEILLHTARLQLMLPAQVNRKRSILLMQRAEDLNHQNFQGDPGDEKNQNHIMQELDAPSAKKIPAVDIMKNKLDLLQKAYKYAPTFMPVGQIYVEQLLACEQWRKAATIIERLWSVQPSQTLANLYYRAKRAKEGSVILQAAQRLTRLSVANHEEDVQSHLVRADAALCARDWRMARQALQQAIEQQPNPSALFCDLMARLEDNETGDPAKVREWLERRAAAPPSSVWVCRDCGMISEAWEALCCDCGAFDALTLESIRTTASVSDLSLSDLSLSDRSNLSPFLSLPEISLSQN